MSELTFGIIGLGQRGLSYGQLLARELSGVGRVTALADINVKRMAGAADLMGLTDVAFHSDYHDLLADPAIDAVIVTTPDFTHELVATDALMAG
ncbi:MAG: Gfo/Idh/MocA family oxidoreductase, partial [Firmicutes bacterium]|nr:Gfo/Idh/MocA family oxidoreductase [Bacillota bacterium]